MTQKPTNIWHCLWALPFLLIGGGLFVYTIFGGVAHLTGSLTQVVVPGKAELSLQRGRTYTVFLEQQSVVNNKVYSTTQSIVGLECRVRSLENGATIAVQKSSMSTSYTIGERSGHSVLEFPIQNDGNYEFACDYGENQSGPLVVLAVGSGVGEDIFHTVAVALGAFFGGIGGSLIVVVAVLIKREREKNRIMKLGQAQV